MLMFLTLSLWMNTILAVYSAPASLIPPPPGRVCPANPSHTPKDCAPCWRWDEELERWMRVSCPEYLVRS